MALGRRRERLSKNNISWKPGITFNEGISDRTQE